MKAIKSVLIEAAPGELIDKITILEIKRDRITDRQSRHNVSVELQSLKAAHARDIVPSQELDDLTAALRTTNEALWDIEDAIRLCEREQDFGSTFTELARSVYRSNDRRAAVKRQINKLLGSELLEEKSYADYE